MDIQKFIEDWLTASNSFKIENYIEFYDNEAILEDSTLGETFTGRSGITHYFESYFIGYGTKTTIQKVQINDNSNVHIDALFDGESFKGLNGVFELNFENGKIKRAKCYLR